MQTLSNFKKLFVYIIVNKIGSSVTNCKSVFFLAACIATAVSNTTYAQEVPFYPTWKLLDGRGKQLYISGYLHGLRDAEEIVKIARDYVEKNPELAVQTLDKVRRLCSVADVNSSSLVPELDSFYSNIDNQQAALSLAVSNAGRNVRSPR